MIRERGRHGARSPLAPGAGGCFHPGMKLLPRFLALMVIAATACAAPRAITVDDLLKFHRVSDPQLSPDGMWLAYVVTAVLYDENRTDSDIWLIPSSGGEPRRLTNSPKHDRHPRWSPDGRWLAFESNRDGDTQIWLLPVHGGAPRFPPVPASRCGRPRETSSRSPARCSRSSPQCRLPRPTG
jgi:hypothetical protein